MRRYINLVGTFVMKVGDFVAVLLLDKRWLTFALAIVILLLAVATRFLPTTIPDKGLVFDEAYFVPQTESYAVNRYFFDIHPPLGKMFLYLGLTIYNPDAAEKLDPEKLANLVNNYATPLNLEGIRLMPKVFGSLVPVLFFLILIEVLNWRAKTVSLNQYLRRNLLAFLGGIMLVFENTFVVDSRYALLTQILIFFMLLTLLFAFRYVNARQFNRTEIYFALTCFAFGAAGSVKWLALGLAPALVMLLLYKEYATHLQQKSRARAFLSLTSQRVIFAVLAGAIVYLGSFAWHFNQLKTFSPAAYEVSAAYQEELKTGDKKVSFLNKVVEWHKLSDNYSKHVPPLDYGKSDEIGSMWMTWPVMARPINYYWQGGGKAFGFLYLLGNPAVWLASFVGMFVFAALGVGRVFGRNRFRYKHLILLVLFLANWLPFLLIERVMYLYHYIPAMMIGVLLFIVALEDFLLPRLVELRNSLPRRAQIFTSSGLWLLMYVLIVSTILITFVIYSPFTYIREVTYPQWEQRVLLKEWHMKWPGDKEPD